MAPEAQVIFLLVALVAFLVAALVEWGVAPRPPGLFYVALGLAAAICVPLWDAVKAI